MILNRARADQCPMGGPASYHLVSRWIRLVGLWFSDTTRDDRDRGDEAYGQDANDGVRDHCQRFVTDGVKAEDPRVKRDSEAVPGRMKCDGEGEEQPAAASHLECLTDGEGGAVRWAIH